MKGSRLPAAALAVLTIGAAVLFLADATIVRTGAALVLLGGIALGVFAIATPEFLAGDRGQGPG